MIVIDLSTIFCRLVFDQQINLHLKGTPF